MKFSLGLTYFLLFYFLWFHKDEAVPAHHVLYLFLPRVPGALQEIHRPDYR